MSINSHIRATVPVFLSLNKNNEAEFDDVHKMQKALQLLEQVHN